MHDVSEYFRRTEEALRQSRDQEVLLDRLTEGILILQGSTPTYANPTFLRLFGYPSGLDLSGKNVREFFAPGSMKTYQRSLKEFLRNAQPMTFEISCVRADGVQVDFIVSLSGVEFGGPWSSGLRCIDPD